MTQLYVRPLLMGREVARDQMIATQMQNIAYLVGDREAKQCLAVDPAWDVQGILDAAAEDGMTVVGVLATHCHADHVGGSIFGFKIEGVAKLVELAPCKVHVHRLDAARLRKNTKLSDGDVIEHGGGDHIAVGAVDIELLHTPGHTPGSSCFRAQEALFAGDTLFVQGCGRVDLPGSDPAQMRLSLLERLAEIPDDVMLYPGHAYGGEQATFEEVRRINPCLAPGGL